MRAKLLAATMVGLTFALAVPASAAPGIGGYPVKTYAPDGRFTKVYAYNPTDEPILVMIGSDVPWLIPSPATLKLEPNEEYPIGVEVVRPVDKGAVGHVTLVVHQGDVAGGVGLAIVNAKAPPAEAGSAFPVVPVVGISVIVIAMAAALALLRRRPKRPRAYGFG